MENVLVSISVLAGAVTVCEVLRRIAKELLWPWRGRSKGNLSRSPHSEPPNLEVVVELFSTLQLCICTHELRLLGSSGLLGLIPALTLTYLATLIHVSTFGSATCNPVSCLEHYLCGQSNGQIAAAKVLAQLAAASVARQLMELVWALDMSDLHWYHHQRQYKCTSTLNTTAENGLVTEFTCAFTLRAALFRFHLLKQRHKIHVVAALITFLVFAAGDLTGAVFNPVLAYSITFNCEGSTYPEYCFVYWLGPLMGAMTAVLLFERESVDGADARSATEEAKEKRS
ncbi:aquaporin-11 isoform X1 [Rhincodon typus]|uniref:aquaporin-11 isoform X1 n=1 Tax=Rhincodon typus TaxID=259920 RepID=UPI0009A37332|nr:aquaporin-11 isoform X1 [Rhincodon typus]